MADRRAAVDGALGRSCVTGLTRWARALGGCSAGRRNHVLVVRWVGAAAMHHCRGAIGRGLGVRCSALDAQTGGPIANGARPAVCPALASHGPVDASGRHGEAGAGDRACCSDSVRHARRAGRGLGGVRARRRRRRHARGEAREDENGNRTGAHRSEGSRDWAAREGGTTAAHESGAGTALARDMQWHP